MFPQIKNNPRGIRQQLVDTLKNLSNYLLGTTHILSLEHESRKIAHTYHHHIKKSHPNYKIDQHTTLHAHALDAQKHSAHYSKQKNLKSNHTHPSQRPKY